MFCDFANRSVKQKGEKRVMDAPEWIVKELDFEKKCKKGKGREIEQRGEGNLEKIGRSARRRHEKKEKYLEETSSGALRIVRRMTWFEKLLASAAAGPGVAHSITKLPPWRGVIEDVTEDAQLKKEEAGMERSLADRHTATKLRIEAVEERFLAKSTRIAPTF